MHRPGCESGFVIFMLNSSNVLSITTQKKLTSTLLLEMENFNEMNQLFCDTIAYMYKCSEFFRFNC